MITARGIRPDALLWHIVVQQHYMLSAWLTPSFNLRVQDVNSTLFRPFPNVVPRVSGISCMFHYVICWFVGEQGLIHPGWVVFAVITWQCDCVAAGRPTTRVGFYSVSHFDVPLPDALEMARNAFHWACAVGVTPYPKTVSQVPLSPCPCLFCFTAYPVLRLPVSSRTGPRLDKATAALRPNPGLHCGFHRESGLIGQETDVKE